jgi:hypothetical protein
MSPADPRIIRSQVSRADLRELAHARFGDMAKAVVDVARGIMARVASCAREEFCRLFFDDTVSPSSAAGLRRHFLAFAVAARSH